MAAVSALTRVSAKGTIRLIDEAADSPSMSSIVGSQAARSLWADAAATTIALGGGAAQTFTVGSAVGASTTTVRSGTGGLSVTAAGVTPITFTTNALARMRVPGDGGQELVGLAVAPTVSAAGEAKLYYDTALNQVRASLNTAAYAALGGQSTISQTNGNAGAITEGQVVYHTTATGTVNLATAAADNALARAFGVVTDATIAAAASGSIAIVGQRRLLRFETALTLNTGDEIYLSATTPGSVTNVAPATTGQVIQTLGVVDDLNGYDGVAALLVYVIFTLGPKAVA